MGQYFDLSSVNLEAIAELVRQQVPAATDEDVEEFIDADWPNAGEHQEWLNTASDAEIARWVGDALADTEPSQVVA